MTRDRVVSVRLTDTEYAELTRRGRVSDTIRDAVHRLLWPAGLRDDPTRATSIAWHGTDGWSTGANWPPLLTTGINGRVWSS